MVLRLWADPAGNLLTWGRREARDTQQTQTHTHTEKKITVRHSCIGNYAEELIHSHRDIALCDLKALAVVVLRHTQGLQIDLLPLEVVERV